MGCTCDFEKRLAAVEGKLKNVRGALEFTTCWPTEGEAIAEKLIRKDRDGMFMFGSDALFTPFSNFSVGFMKRDIARAIDQALAEASR